MPCFSFVTSTSFTCCCAAVALEQTTNRRQRQNRNGSCCLANELLLGISGCSYERAVLAPLPGAIGACIILCEKAWHWCPVAWNRPHIFMMQSILQDIQTLAWQFILYTNFRAGVHLLPSRCHFSSNNISILFQSDSSTWQRPFQKTAHFNDITLRIFGLCNRGFRTCIAGIRPQYCPYQGPRRSHEMWAF